MSLRTFCNWLLKNGILYLMLYEGKVRVAMRLPLEHAKANDFLSFYEDK